MRTLKAVEELRREARNALFTKQQAIQVALKLFEREISDPDNTDDETRALLAARGRVGIHYLDETSTVTDEILDAAGVARLTADNIADAIDVMLFEAQ